MSRVCVVGLGYIGLPTAALLADSGHQVFGVDVNTHAVETIQQGKIHIFEPDLETLVHRVVKSGTLKAQTQATTSDIFILCVPTPFKENHQPDTSCVEAAFRSVLPHLEKGNLVILESTSPVGTTRKLSKILEAERSELKDSIYFAYGPERVLPGRILIELKENSRIVGGLTPEAAHRAAVFYKTITHGQVFQTNSETAEMAKLTENAFRDVNIAFANELSLICDRLGIDVWELRKLANHHPRVNILEPGPGVGGHCIAVDPWFIVSAAPEESGLIRKARETNLYKTEFVTKQILETVKGSRKLGLAFLGLTYKPDIDDIRESPAMEILEALLEEEIGEVYVVEPNLKTLPKSLMDRQKVHFVNLDEAFEMAGTVALLVDHKEFKAVDPKKLINKNLVDTRGVWSSIATRREMEATQRA